MSGMAVRKRNRLKDYDYSQNGAYFVTLCVKDRAELLCEISVVPYDDDNDGGDYTHGFIFVVDNGANRRIIRASSKQRQHQTSRREEFG